MKVTATQWQYILEAHRGELSMAKVLIDGRKVLFHHWEPWQSATPELHKAWEEADLVVCCHPTYLPSRVRTKHISPNHKGVLFIEPYLNTDGSVEIRL